MTMESTIRLPGPIPRLAEIFEEGLQLSEVQPPKIDLGQSTSGPTNANTPGLLRSRPRKLLAEDPLEDLAGRITRNLVDKVHQHRLLETGQLVFAKIQNIRRR